MLKLVFLAKIKEYLPDMISRVIFLILSLPFVAIHAAEQPVSIAPAEVDEHYLLQPGDMIQISVWKERDLDREILIRPDGRISFPLAGDIQAEGKTVAQLEKEVARNIGKYVPDAVVTVVLRSPGGNQIFVTGRVTRPGSYTSARTLDVVQAIALAGGLTPFASPNKIKILRRVNDVETVISFRYGRIEKGKSLTENIILQSGDVVVVP